MKTIIVGGLVFRGVAGKVTVALSSPEKSEKGILINLDIEEDRKAVAIRDIAKESGKFRVTEAASPDSLWLINRFVDLFFPASIKRVKIFEDRRSIDDEDLFTSVVEALDEVSSIIPSLGFENLQVYYLSE